MDKVISFGEALVDMLSSRMGQSPSAEDESSALERFTKYPGGAPANVAAAVGKLGGRSYFAGKVGEDMFGDFMRESLNQAGVNTAYLLQTRRAKTALAFVSLDRSGKRSFEFYRAPSADLFFRAEEFQAGWFAEPGLFHFCSNTLTEPGIRGATLAGLRLAREHGFTVSFDVNLRPALWPLEQDPLEPIWECIEQADLVKLCVEELAFLCRQQSRDAVIRRMRAAGVSLILVTDGGAPLHYYTSRDEGRVVPPAVAMVDSTAAGDAFIGGVLYALADRQISAPGLGSLAGDPESLERILRFGCACGAHAVTRKGAFTSLPGRRDLPGLGWG